MNAESRHGMLPSLQRLVVEYAAQVSDAESLDTVDWQPLASRLRVPLEMLTGAVDALSPTDRANLWVKILERRIDLVQATKGFTDSSWDQIEHKVASALERMLVNNGVRKVDELLAVAKAVEQRKYAKAGVANPPPGVPAAQVNLNIGPWSGLDMGDSSGALPGKMSAPVYINLSERSAKALTEVKPVSSTRIIDGERLTVEELREVNMRGEAEAGVEADE